MIRKRAVLVLCLGLLLAASITAPAMAQTTTCDETQIRTDVQRVIDEGFNQGSTGVIDEVFADNYVDHPGETTRDDFKSQIEQIRTAIPNGQAVIDHLLVQGCDAFFNFVDSGVMEGALGSDANALPATNQPLSLQNHVYLHFNDAGQVAEEWDYNDNLPFMMQLGLFPTQQPSTEATLEMTPQPVQEPIAAGGNEARNTALLQQAYDQNFNAGDLDTMRSLFGPDYVGYNTDNTTSSLDDFFGTLTALRGAMPDLKITINGQVAEGDYVATRVTLAGTFQNDLTFPGSQAISPTNQPISIEMSFLDQVSSDGLITADWTVYDQVSFLSQLGLMTNPEQTPEATP